MPEFYRERGIVGTVRYREGNHMLVHAHFTYAEYELSVAITEEGAYILEGDMPRNKKRQIENALQDQNLRKKALSLWK